MSSSAPASLLRIVLPDGSAREFPGPVTAGEVAASIGAGLAKAALAAKVNGKIVDLSYRIESDAELSILTAKSPESLELVRHSTTHLMAQAIKRLRPGAMLEDGPPTEDGFWYDIKTDPPLALDDFPAIEAEMAKIAKEALPIQRRELSRDEAIVLFRERGEKYKLDIIERLAADATISVYAQGEFVDLCRGPHVPNTAALKAFKLTAVAGAYWKGDARNEQLTRIKGTAFHDKKDLDAHLALIEEAKKRDHRKLGRELDLFMHHEYAPGETFWLAKGKTMYGLLSRMMSDLCREEGYDEVFTPMLFKADLFKESGHWFHYRENMFIAPNQETNELGDEQVTAWAEQVEHEVRADASEWRNVEPALAHATTPAARLSALLKGSKSAANRHWYLFEKLPGTFVELRATTGEPYALKPMNCPSHMLIFRDKKRSYRELPMRIHDQGVLHRNEITGALSGLTRVRQFCQDDAHIFLAQDQIEGEITKLIALVKRVYQRFDMEFAKVFLSTRPDKYLGEKETWDRAEAALEGALKANGVEYGINAGDGAFYGPKIDFIVRDCIGREWQTATIQLDYQLPARFGLEFINRHNQPECPVVVHRAIVGSFERFMGVLIEHYAGAFPTWLAPVQARVLTISEKYDTYGADVFDALRRAGVRAEKDFGAEKIGSKIRDGRNARIPYLVTVGEKEAADRTVSVRSQSAGELGVMPLDAFLQKIAAEKDARF